MRNGFTLAETAFATAALAILAGIGLPLLFRPGMDSIRTAEEALIEQLRQAQLLARAGAGDSPWGVRLENSRSILFKGPGFDTRDPEADIEILFPGDLFVAGGYGTEIVFAKTTGDPLQPGWLSLSNGRDVRMIEVNTYGAILR